MNDTITKTCNLNDTVKVVLTEKGKEHFKKFYENLLTNYERKLQKKLIDEYMEQIKEGNVLSMTLHEFMHIFGSGLMVGGPNLIENNLITFE